MREVSIGRSSSVIFVVLLDGSKTVCQSKTLGSPLAKFPWSGTFDNNSAITRVGLTSPGQLVTLTRTVDNDSAVTRVGLTLSRQIVTSDFEFPVLTCTDLHSTLSPFVRRTRTLDNYSAMTRVSLAFPGQQSMLALKST